jgi:hypothetical protein
MQMIGCRYGHGVNIARREALDISCPSTSEFFGGKLGAAFVGVADDSQASTGAISEGKGMIGAPYTRANNASLH